MEILDTAEGKEPIGGAEGRISIDRFEAVLRFDEREEEEKVEAAMALYEKAARARMPAELESVEELDPEQLEELEEQSRQLKLQQKCQDIAAQLLVEELEDELEEELEEAEHHRKRRRKQE